MTLRSFIFTLTQQEAEALKDLLRTIPFNLTTTVIRSSDFTVSMLSMQCMSLVLDKHAQITTQFHIEDVLAAITIKAFHLESKRTDRHSAMLYGGLCRLFTTILAVHRIKLGGRYHLILQVLQGLLHCLFTPYAGSSSLPGLQSIFTETHAAAYAKLLTTLCNPTVSAVMRSKKRRHLELNDETKKVRSMAGIYLRLLIIDYCMSSLKGALTPAMKVSPILLVDEVFFKRERGTPLYSIYDSYRAPKRNMMPRPLGFLTINISGVDEPSCGSGDG